MIRKEVYTVPSVLLSDLIMERNFVLSQLEDYPNNPIYRTAPLDYLDYSEFESEE